VLLCCSAAVSLLTMLQSWSGLVLGFKMNKLRVMRDKPNYLLMSRDNNNK
jgi:hypothetical protein